MLHIIVSTERRTQTKPGDAKMTNIETAIQKSMKASKKDGKTYFVYATYYKVLIATRAPAFGAAHWRVNADGFTRVEDEYVAAKLAAGL